MSIFDIQKFYNAAHKADPVDKEGFIEFAKEFENLIVWGGGNLGTAVGVKMHELGLSISSYWDMRADHLQTINGIGVEKPFETAYPAHKTLHIFCIASSFIRDRLKTQLEQEGYFNILMGQYLYEGLICPLDKYDSKVCINSDACDSYTCVKNDSLFKNKTKIKISDDPTGKMIFRNLTIVVNQKCTLKCKFCYSYTNHYVGDNRLNFSTERILKDIDLFFDAVDGVKLVPLIGGEAFMHPDLNKIVKKILTKDNFGILNVTTNGVCKITAEDLDGYTDDRVQMVFSNYKECITEQQRDLYDKNVEFARSQGVHVIVPNDTPQWAMPTSLYDQNDSIEIMQQKFKVCRGEFDCKYLKNGYFYPCPIVDPVHCLGIADHPTDYVNIGEVSSSEELRYKIQEVELRDHYKTCGHCTTGGLTGLVTKAGEQGYHDFITKPEEINNNL